MFDSIGWVDDWLDYLFSFGTIFVYALIFLACFVENIFPPFPGDTFILGGGALVATGRLELYPVMAVVLVGGLASTMLLYYYGLRYGREYFLKRDFSYFSSRDVYKVEASLKKWGGAILLSSRFIIGFRSALAASAGIARYPVARMFIYSMGSYLLFAGLLMYLSMALVDNFDLVSRYFRTYQSILWPIIGILLVFFVVRRFMEVRSKRESKDTE